MTPEPEDVSAASHREAGAAREALRREIVPAYAARFATLLLRRAVRRRRRRARRSRSAAPPATSPASWRAASTTSSRITAVRRVRRPSSQRRAARIEAAGALRAPIALRVAEPRGAARRRRRPPISRSRTWRWPTAPDPDAAAREMARVLAPGGTRGDHGAAAGHLGGVPRSVPGRAPRERQARAPRRRSTPTSPACPTRRPSPAGSTDAGLADVSIEVERWEILFKSSREFFFAPLVELGPLPQWKRLAGARRRHAGRLLLHEGGDRHLLQGPPVRGHRVGAVAWGRKRR